MVKVKVISKTKKAVKFELSETSPAFANALRRTILNKVQVMAIDKVRINKNSSALYNEVLAHRLGLVPLSFEPDAYKEGETVVLSLKAAGPGTVYSGEMKSQDPKVAPIDAKIPIAKLLAGQEIDLECVARLGSGSEHARWQPAIVGYQYKSEKDSSTIILTVETTSGLAPEDIVIKAAEILGRQLEEIRKQL